MSYIVQIHSKTPAFNGGPDHEITLINPHGAKRWFTATGLYQAKVIASYWADFFGLDHIDLFLTPEKPVEFISLQSIVIDSKAEYNEKTGNDQDGPRTATDSEI